MSLEAPYLSQLLLISLLAIIGFFVRAKLSEIMHQLEELNRSAGKTRERLIRIETKLGIEDDA